MRFLVIFLGVYLFGYIGYVSEAKGKVEVIRNKSVLSVKKGFKIEEKDSVKTYKNSKAKMVFKDNTVIIVGENSFFKVYEYLYGKKPKARFGFLRGTFLSVTGKIGKIAPKKFKLQTKNSSIGIRGTTVFGEIYYGGDIIGCSSGAIDVAEGKKNVFVKAGEAVGVFGSLITRPFRPAKGYVKEVAKKMSLDKKEEESFFARLFATSKKDVKTPQADIKKSDKEKNFTLTWDEYKIEKLKTIKGYTTKAIQFDNGVFFDEMRFH